MKATRRYAESKEQLLGRLARAEGQVRGVRRMVVEDRDCVDILIQIAAARGALEGIALGLLDRHARHCILGEGEAREHPDDAVEELMGAVRRLVTS